LSVALVINASAAHTLGGFMIGLASGVLGALGAVLIWRLGGLDSISAQLAWLMLVLTGASVALAPWCLTWPEQTDWSPIATMAATTTGSQIILAHAFKIAPADKSITWGYMSVVFAAVFDAIFWSEWLTPWATAGVGLVVFGSVIASLTSSNRFSKRVG
jgi:drug/metabolite transporter (DMT)-like permease